MYICNQRTLETRGLSNFKMIVMVSKAQEYLKKHQKNRTRIVTVAGKAYTIDVKMETFARLLHDGRYPYVTIEANNRKFNLMKKAIHDFESIK